MCNLKFAGFLFLFFFFEETTAIVYTNQRDLLSLGKKLKTATGLRVNYNKGKVVVEAVASGLCR